MSEKTAQELEPIGAAIKRRPGLKVPSSTQLRLIESGADIRRNLAEEISFQHTVLCQTGLPYRSTEDRRWEQRNGRVFLEIEAGRVLDPKTEKYIDMPLPFGPKARLILIYLCSAAIQGQSPVIDVEASMTKFLSKLQGRDPNGPEIRKFKQQIASLASATIRMATVIEGRSLQVNNQVVHKFDLTLKKNDETQRVLWPETVELTMDFFNTLKDHAVPLDPRAVAALAHSAMALDVYAWLAQRLWRIGPKSDAMVPWISLHQQFGQGYKQIRQLRAVFLDTLRDVLTQYPGAQVVPTQEGVILKKSPPPVTSTKLLSVTKYT